MAAGSVNSGLTPAAYRLRRIIFFPAPIAGQIMKIGTLLTTAIVSLSTVGGGLAVYVAVTKYQTMDRIAEAQGRLAIVRAASDIPRYLNPERGFATNILYGPATVDPAQLTEHDKLRKQTDGARDRMNALRKELPGPFDDGATIGSNIDAINSKFTALREAIDKAIAGPADARKDAAKKVVADNAVLNAGVTALLNEQVRRMAILNGDAYRQSNYANIAMTLRDVGGLNSSVHKNLVGAKKVANDAEKADMARMQGRNDQIVMSLMELRGNAATPANVAAALETMNSNYVEEFGREMKLVKDGAVSGKYEHDVETFYVASQKGLGSIIGVRDAFYDNAEQILAGASSAARTSFTIALAGLLAVLIASAGLIVMVRRRVCAPIVSLTTRMSRLADGDVADEIPGAERSDEIGAMASAVQVFKDNMIRADRLAAEKQAENDGKMRRAQALDGLTRAFEAKVTELVGGLSRASSTMESTAQSMTSTAAQTNSQAAVVAAASQQTSTNVDGRQRDRRADLLDLRDRPAGGTKHRDRGPRRRQRPPHRRHGARARRGRPEDRRRRHADPEHRRADQSAGAQRDHRSRPRRRRRPRLCGRRIRGEVAGGPDRQGHHRNLRADHRDPVRKRRDRERDPQRRRRHRRDRPDRHRDCGCDRRTGLGNPGDLPQRAGGRARHPGGQHQHIGRAARRRRHRCGREGSAGRRRAALDPVARSRRPVRPLPR